MKRNFTFLTFFAIIILSFGCNDETPDLNAEGEWELVEIGSHWTREVLTGEDITFQETYVFNQDGAFVKTNTDLDRQSSGVFTKIFPETNEFNIKEILKLTFDPDGFVNETGVRDGMINGCPEDRTEDLLLRNDGTILNSGSCIADGPILTYRKRR